MARMARTYRRPMAWVEGRLAELARLEPDWDSYGGFPPTDRAVADAASIMRTAFDRFGRTAGERAIPYGVFPIADGGIQLEWHGPSSELELNVGPEGGLSFLVIEHPDGDRRFTEGYDLSADEALELVRRVIHP